ncbi:hypothetical protein [Pantoea dispersa]|uniref:hypothetical protein n=1 Tax=Pantoea dispersa TaxID=59814 RepID=UPI001EE72198|nr:hypothetical protein [Pantoea dispersa]UKY36455.1 hypothetical protein KFZ74_19625 [Pantoea dispersa]
MMTKVRMDGINISLREVEVRLFSPRGAHLVGMVARTKIAKDLRIWLLNLAEKESGIELGQLPVNELASLTGQKLHDAIVVFNQKSFTLRGQRGSRLMAQRKRDIK